MFTFFTLLAHLLLPVSVSVLTLSLSLSLLFYSFRSTRYLLSIRTYVCLHFVVLIIERIDRSSGRLSLVSMNTSTHQDALRSLTLSISPSLSLSLITVLSLHQLFPFPSLKIKFIAYLLTIIKDSEIGSQGCACNISDRNVSRRVLTGVHRGGEGCSAHTLPPPLPESH